ncbi:MAG: F0F1 ATP synthase subunit C [Alphaproteobacteria bacterium]|nr:F0F1 ATP synthase subunit C [Alphaproteobacteria bacterium]
MEEMNYITEAAKYLSIGICSLVMISVAKWVAQIWITIITSVSRNPSTKSDVTLFAYIGAGMTEAIALYALALAFMMLFS